MAEEFQESEVVFQELNFDNEDTNTEDYDSAFNSRKKPKIDTSSTVEKNSSSPMNIPENVRRSSWFRYVDEDLDGGDGELVPPHVIVRRRVTGKSMAFSVCTGNGRTLKGRDLSEVRNAILRMTGFLET